MADPASARAKVAVLISGTGSNMAALIYASRLPDAKYEIVLVASNRPDAAGLTLARAEGIATFAHSHKGMERADHDAVMDDAVRQSGAEYIALAGYMRILSEGFAAKWQGKMLNIHPSLLPKYKGLETHQRALDAGDSHCGSSVHLVTPELDSGDLLGRMPVAIQADDTAESLAERVKLAEHQLYPAALSDYVGRANDPAWLLNEVRRLALEMPEAEERESHGSPGWRTGGKSGKYFAYFSDQHHGVEHIALLVRTGGQDELLALVERDPDVYFKPAYYGASGWVGLILNRANVDWEHVAEWLERSWKGVAPKRLTKLLDAAEEF